MAVKSSFPFREGGREAGWVRLAALLSIAASIALFPRCALANPVIEAHVDPGIQYGVWQGWGTSLAWWANVVGGFPAPARQDYVAKAFDPARGLGLNIARYNIGGGENPDDLPPNRSAMQYRARVPGFEPAPGVWDWSADANQRRALQEAIGLGVSQTEAFSNSPPYWMTVSGSVTGESNGGDNLPIAQDAHFADYLAAVVKHFRDDWGVKFRDVEPLNEPASPWWRRGNYQEGCHFSPLDQARIIKALAASLKSAGVAQTSIAASDENNPDDAANTLAAWDAGTLAEIVKINTHTYDGGDRARLAQVVKASGKEFWVSEYGDGDASGLTMSRQILSDVRQMHPSAWCYWQAVDSAPGWGFLLNPLADETTTSYTINEKYYVMGQYSRFIRPGYEIIDVDEPSTLAAYDAASKTLVLVTTSTGQAASAISFDLSRFHSTGSYAAATRTSTTDHWTRLPKLPITNGTLRDTLPADSVTTYVVTGAIYSPTVQKK